MADDDPSKRSDLDDGLRFLHLMGMQTKQEVADVAATLYAAVEELVARGVVDLRALEARRERKKAEEGERMRTQAHVQVAPAVDKYAVPSPPVDCATLLPLCQARCCRLVFPLSFQDLDERVVQWDYARPYQIRRRADEYCVHSDEVTRACGVYAQRPAICRAYDCREDKRIWTDFERRIPAPAEALYSISATPRRD
jgi:Fe-S-cluster containining protein